MGIPRWADLRSVGNSSAVRAAIIVPVIGYLIILNSTIADYLKLHGIEWGQDSHQFWDRLWSFKLYLIYYGLMLLGAGSIVYQWKCPHFVKKYENWAEYVAGVARHTDGGQIDVLHKLVGRDETFGYGMSGEEQILYYLRRHYNQMSSYSAAWRLLTTFLFAWGFVLLAIPSVMTAVRVASALISGEIRSE